MKDKKESVSYIYSEPLFAQSTQVSVSFIRITIQTCKGTTERTHCEWNMFVYISFRVRALACSITHSCNTVHGRKTLARFVKREKSDIVFVPLFRLLCASRAADFAFPLSFWILIKLLAIVISLPIFKSVHIVEEICIKQINNTYFYIFIINQHTSRTLQLHLWHSYFSCNELSREREREKRESEREREFSKNITSSRLHFGQVDHKEDS